MSNPLEKKDKPETHEKLEFDIREEILPTIENLTQTKILESIGTGGFSVVRKSYNEENNKYYALKVVNFIILTF